LPDGTVSVTFLSALLPSDFLVGSGGGFNVTGL